MDKKNAVDDERDGNKCDENKPDGNGHERRYWRIRIVIEFIKAGAWGAWQVIKEFFT